jgi:hypothetical protein
MSKLDEFEKDADEESELEDDISGYDECDEEDYE